MSNEHEARGREEVGEVGSGGTLGCSLSPQDPASPGICPQAGPLLRSPAPKPPPRPEPPWSWREQRGRLAQVGWGLAGERTVQFSLHWQDLHKLMGVEQSAHPKGAFYQKNSSSLRHQAQGAWGGRLWATQPGPPPPLPFPPPADWATDSASPCLRCSFRKWSQ